MDDRARQLYAEMGVTPVINCIGNMTMLGGSSPSPRVQDAMQVASRYYVDMDVLLESTGRIIAGMLECEAALVTPGCAAALMLGTAACMTGTDPEKMGRLPDSGGMKREIVIQKVQRYKYDRVVRMPGTRIVEAGTEAGTTPDQLDGCIGPDTVAILYPASGEGEGVVPIQEAIAIAHQHDIPIIVDAAYHVFPTDALKRYTGRGADLVGYGAKYFGAPNSTGLLCGREDLVEAARLHSFASFEKRSLPGLGRPLKVDRQEVIAAVVALREWLETDHGARWSAADRRGRNLRRALSGLPHVQVSPEAEDAEVTVLSVRLDEAVLGRTAAEVDVALREGNPSIWANLQNGALSLYMFTVVDGDEHIVAERLWEVLTGSAA